MRRLLLVVLLAALAACSPSTPRAQGPDNGENKAAMRAVLEELRRGEEVIEVTGGYETDITTYGQVDITITVPDGTPVEEQEALLDRAEQLVWRSPIDPILTFGVLVLEPSTPPDAMGRQRLYQGEERVAQLEEKYGPR